MGDSGAIIVGAGSSNTSHSKLSFSTYGQRVNVQGWGQNVFSLGYGGYAQHGGDKRQRYTSGFNGTSSASPFIASASISLQGIYRARTGETLTSRQIRSILIATGIPQGSGGHIGPFPNMERAARRSAYDVGDMNCDGAINTLDIEPFIAALTAPDDYWANYPDCEITLGDINFDDEVNALDVEAYVELLMP
jgi:hypothetical protein